MTQANQQPTTNYASTLPAARGASLKSTITSAMRKLHDSIAAARNLISPTAFVENGRSSDIRTIMVPIPDNGWAPALWCGEFAMVDTNDRELRPGEFFLRRHEGGSLAIVRPEIHDEKHGIIQGQKSKPDYVCENGPSGGWYWDGLFWWFTYAAQSARRLDGKPFDVDDPDPTNAFLAHFHMSDGPLGDRQARKEIVGRVTGVLGHEGRSLNWRRWVHS